MEESIQGERGWEHHHFLCQAPLFSAALPALDHSGSLGPVSPPGPRRWRSWDVAEALTQWRVSSLPRGWEMASGGIRPSGTIGESRRRSTPGARVLGIPVSRGTSGYSLTGLCLSLSTGGWENRSWRGAVYVLPVRGRGPQAALGMSVRPTEWPL